MRSGHTMTTLAAMVLCAATAAAADGVLVVQKMTSASGAVSTNQVDIEKTRMRAEIAAANGRKQTMVFDGTAQVMRTIDDEAKTYTEMTRADVEQLGGQVSGAKAQLEQQMKNMPPEARARMEEMMKGRGMTMAGAAPIEYRKVGTDKVGKWTCDQYEGTRNGKKTSEVCTVATTVLGFAPADFEVTRQMAEFFSKLLPQGAEQMFSVGSATPNGLAGVPVRTVTFRDGAVQSTTEMVEVSRQNFPDSTFTVPAGYTKRDLMSGRGRGRR